MVEIPKCVIEIPQVQKNGPARSVNLGIVLTDLGRGVQILQSSFQPSVGAISNTTAHERLGILRFDLQSMIEVRDGFFKPSSATVQKAAVHITSSVTRCCLNCFGAAIDGLFVVALHFKSLATADVSRRIIRVQPRRFIQIAKGFIESTRFSIGKSTSAKNP